MAEIRKILEYFSVGRDDSEALSLDQINNIQNKMKKTVCKIVKNNNFGTGFFCYIPFYNIFIPVLITCNHILNEEDISLGKTINISINNDNIFFKLFIDISRITYTNKKYDTTFIEIKETDCLNMISFLSIDETIFQRGEENNFKNITILNIHYPFGQIVKSSFGKIIKIQEFKINYYSSINFGSSGSPIINLKNNKVIGINKAYKEIVGIKINTGIYIKWPVKDFNLYIKKRKIIIKNIISNNIKVANKNANISISQNEQNIIYNKEEKSEFKEDIKKSNNKNYKNNGKMLTIYYLFTIFFEILIKLFVHNSSLIFMFYITYKFLNIIGAQSFLYSSLAIIKIFHLIWGFIILYGGQKDKNGPALQSGIWQIIGSIII